jgi:hypothetical protein
VTRGQEPRFLDQVALNLRAHGGLLAAPNHDVKHKGGGHDDDQEGRHQLEENPVSQFVLTVLVLSVGFTSGLRSGSRRHAPFSDSEDSPGPVRFFPGCAGRRHQPTAA